MDLRGKRLLILGCSNNADDVKAYADKTGVTIVFAGMWFSPSVQRIANETYVIDIMNADELRGFLKRGNIDGVFVGGNEAIISVVADVLEELGYPFYTSKKLWSVTSDKSAFKMMCRKNGVPVTHDYQLDADGNSQDDGVSFPVVVKPVDGCGSIGVTLCHSRDELNRSIQTALDCSKTARFLAEEYVDGEEIVVYYTFCDGRVTLTSMCDRYNRNDGDSFNSLPDLWAYPSKRLDAYCKEIDANMKRMLLDMGIRNGVVGVQGFFDRGRFVFFEMGFRLGGTAQYRYTMACNGISSFEMMMNFALTGKMCGYDQSLDTPYFGKKCCTVTLMNRGGRIARVEGIEQVEARREVLVLEKRYDVGDEVKVTHSLGQMQYWIFMLTDTVDQMRAMIDFVQRTIQVYDDNNVQMLTTSFDTSRLEF